MLKKNNRNFEKRDDLPLNRTPKPRGIKESARVENQCHQRLLLGLLALSMMGTMMKFQDGADLKQTLILDSLCVVKTQASHYRTGYHTNAKSRRRLLRPRKRKRKEQLVYSFHFLSVSFVSTTYHFI